MKPIIDEIIDNAFKMVTDNQLNLVESKKDINRLM
jgi:hypothetical protein